MEGDLGDAEAGMFAEAGAVPRLFSFGVKPASAGELHVARGLIPARRGLSHPPAALNPPRERGFS